MQEEQQRPKFGSPELEVKLIVDTLRIADEIANARACMMIANSIHRPMFTTVFIAQAEYLGLIEMLIPPQKNLHSYLNKNGLLIRKMKPKLQPNVNLAACVALTCLIQVITENEKLKLIASGLIENLLVLYAQTTDDREDVKDAAAKCLRMFSIVVGHRNPTYPDSSTAADTYYDRTLQGQCANKTKKRVLETHSRKPLGLLHSSKNTHI
jgi:hypothetical protein